MQKEELLKLLHDPDVCHEIFQIVKNLGKPSGPYTAAQTAGAPAVDKDKLAAIRARLQKDAALKSPAPPSAAADKINKPAAPPEPPAEEESAGSSVSSKLAFLRNQVKKANEKKLAIEQAKQSAKEERQEKYTFVLERKCPVCQEMTRVVKYKSRLIAEKTDADLCTHYQGFNPYLYKVWACEHCGFAADERGFVKYMPEKTRDSLTEMLSKNDLTMEFHEERSVQEAVDLCDMAILFSDLTDSSPGRQARLCLNKAWIYREAGDEEHEREAMQQAAELYEASLEKESYPVDGMSDNTAIYLAGAICFMLGDYDKSAKHLSRLVSDQSLRSSDPKAYERARDLWLDIKNAKK